MDDEEGEDTDMMESLKLEPGESGRLAVLFKLIGLFKIVDLATGHVVAQIHLSNPK